MPRSIVVGGMTMLALASSVAAQDAAPARTRPTFDADGGVNVPAFRLPPSSFLSPEALAHQKARANAKPLAINGSEGMKSIRASIEALMAPRVAEMRRRFAVDVAQQPIAGVPTRMFTPRDRPFDRQRVLINVHGGAFTTCADACSLMESMPIASLGGYKVISIDYRMAPEATHPAAVEDVEKVYRELLKTYPAKRIGLFGCSAGGSLTAQAAAWMPRHGLPQFGAIGIFGSGAVRFSAGDSAYISGNIDGQFAPPPQPTSSARPIDASMGYFRTVAPDDPIVSPGSHPEIIAKYPPTLIITGTRAPDMSPAVVTNSRLLKAGVRSTLIVGEGMEHCYIYDADLPEAQDAYAATVAFFRENLK